MTGGDKLGFILPRQHALTIADPTGRAAVAGFFFNAWLPSERFNAPDTLKAQHTAYLTTGRVLMGDMGHAMLSITADSCGWHDVLGGHLDAEGTLARFGQGRYQELRNRMHRNTRDNILVEFAKHELDERDLHANVNFFRKVAVDAQGGMAWAPNSRPGASITLRAEIDVLCFLSNTPHPWDPADRYDPPDIDLAVAPAAAPEADDPCRSSRPECMRAFILSERFAQERGL